MTTRTSLVLIAALAAGCSAASTPSSAPTPVDTAALAARGLGASSLARTQLLATRDGRDLLAHVVACALPRGTSITAITRDGTPYSFTGAVGLAPAWARHAATRVEHDRVVDCITAQTTGAHARAAAIRTRSRTRPGTAASLGSRRRMELRDRS